VIHTVAAVFGLEESGRTPILQLIINLLHDKDLFLALDNCEHLIEPTAKLAQKLLEECPGIQIMATSRVSLGVPGEILWRVPSMAVPNSVDEKANIREYDAIRLFEERARTTAPGWTLDENAADVVEICTRLDGIPLAIELAGARLRMMTVEQIAARLDDAFRLLTGGSRTALARHQTLRACIDWSYSLLSLTEGALLRQLSVFQGGWTLEAVEFIGQYEPIPGVQPDEILDVLAGLVDRSLVVVQGKGQGMRYRLLDTIRQYAHEKLVEAGEEEAACDRHLAYFLNLAVQAEGQLRGPEQKVWHLTVKMELENLRAALVWALKTNPQIELRMASALFWFWRVRKDWMIEGLRWLERGLAADTNHSGEVVTGDPNRALVRGWALNVTTWFQLYLKMSSAYWTEFSNADERQAADDKRGDYNQEALTLFQGLGKPGRRGWAFALVMKTEQDPQRKKLLLEESFDIFRQEGDKFYMAEGLIQLGGYAEEVKDFGSARRFHEQQLALRNEIGDWEGVVWAHQTLGWLDFSQSNFEDARQQFLKALDICQIIGYIPEQFWRINYFLCDIALDQGKYSEAQLYADNLLAIARENGEDWQYFEGIQKKGNALIQEDSLLAGRLLNQAMLAFHKTGNESDLAYNLESQANLAIVFGQYERAARLLSASLHWWQLKIYPSETYDPPRQEKLRNTIHAVLEEEAFNKAWAEGEAMTLDQAVAYALEDFNPA
jgi:predicted ATPase